LSTAKLALNGLLTTVPTEKSRSWKRGTRQKIQCMVRVGACVVLPQVVMAGNQVMGPLPAAWRALKQLYFVRMDDNDLSGPLPAEW
jgi:hypothetical protein